MVTQMNMLERLLVVPPDVLSRLKCAKCSNFLSCFPIFTTRNGAESICGRCQQDENENTIQNKIYENAVEFLMFPCRYQEWGCIEYFNPNELVKHEDCCDYKRLDCPKKEETGCTWEGRKGDILEHFELNHPIHIMKETKFELDLLHSYTENFLLPHYEEFFTVTIRNNEFQDTIWCSVECLEGKEYAKQFKFHLILSDISGVCLPITLELNPSGIDINKKLICHDLKKPSSIVAKVEVKLIQEKENKITAATEDDLLSELECPICFEYMVPPIYQCIGGHSICNACKPNYSKCPTCQKDIADTQNFTVEKLATKLLYPCRHKNCSYVARANMIKQHETSCLFGTFVCPLTDYTGCKEQLRVVDIMDHVKLRHHDHLLEVNRIVIPFSQANVDEEDDDCYIMRCYQQIFKIHYKYHQKGFHFAVQLVGPPEEADRYRFIIDLYASHRRIRCYLQGECSSLSPKDDCFSENKKHVNVTYNQAKPFITNYLMFNIRVIQIREKLPKIDAIKVL